MRRLALGLVREGFHVLRFDYYGTGDSAGASDAGSLEQWRENIALAADEIKDVAGVKRVSAVGFRLGAALAAQSGVRFRDLVLWEPVLDGRAYLRDLGAMHETAMAHVLHPVRVPRSGPMGELLGHPLPPHLQEEIEAVDLGASWSARAGRVIVVTSEEERTIEGLRAKVTTAPASGTPPTFEIHRVGDLSAPSDEPFLLSSGAQQLIAARLAGKDR